jgi:hypothetical protein
MLKSFLGLRLHVSDVGLMRLDDGFFKGVKARFRSAFNHSFECSDCVFRRSDRVADFNASSRRPFSYYLDDRLREDECRPFDGARDRSDVLFANVLVLTPVQP